MGKWKDWVFWILWVVIGVLLALMFVRWDSETVNVGLRVMCLAALVIQFRRYIGRRS